jgi:hypothetical protein
MLLFLIFLIINELIELGLYWILLLFKLSLLFFNNFLFGLLLILSFLLLLHNSLSFVIIIFFKLEIPLFGLRYTIGFFFEGFFSFKLLPFIQSIESLFELISKDEIFLI